MRNWKKTKMLKIGRMKESLTKHPLRDEFHQKIRAFIPEELICKIILMLPTRSMGRFRCVSKLWLSITTRPSFIRAHVQLKRFAHQTLMIVDPNHKNPHSQTRLFLPDINAKINLRELPQLEILKCSKLKCSCDGLILSWIPTKKRYYVINPLTGNFCILPQSRFIELMGFYFHRPTSEYRLLVNWDDEFTSVLVIGKNKWRRIPEPLQYIEIVANPVDVNESLYWIAWKDTKNDDDEEDDYSPNTLIKFDKETEVFDFLPLPPLKDYNDLRGGSLINLNGELGLWLISDNDIIDFWIMKECWIKRYSIYIPDVKGCSKHIFHEWNESFAVSINDEEVLIGTFKKYKSRFLIHWNLKTGAYLVQSLSHYSSKLLIKFPYIETITFFDHPFKSLLSCS